MIGKKEFGDYQTPIKFAKKVCEYLFYKLKLSPNTIIEPTCGKGSFLQESLIFPNATIYGIEINSKYCKISRSISHKRIHVLNKNILGLKISSLVTIKGKLLIVGNPPWVTNSHLSVLGSDNVPKKNNMKGLRGIDAITGSSNFDICECIIIQLIEEFKHTDSTIAMICKTSVARNIFKYLNQQKVFFSKCEILTIDAKVVFNVSVDACVLVVQLSSKKCNSDTCEVKSFDNPTKIERILLYKNNFVYNNISKKALRYEGRSCFEWRQGVKHDCSKVMELSLIDGKFYNGEDELVDIENDIVYPLVKSSMFKTPIIQKSSKYVIVTQSKIGQNTLRIKKRFPKTWNYLKKHDSFFVSRKSRIYKNSYPYSMFGVGDYSFETYKVGISGFYKKPLFSLLNASNEKPFMVDDTSYFIGFKKYDDAYIAMLLLNEKSVQNFLMGISFSDSKRPYTKKVLERINFGAIVKNLTFESLKETELELGLKRYCKRSMYDNFKKIMKNDL